MTPCKVRSDLDLDRLSTPLAYLGTQKVWASRLPFVAGNGGEFGAGRCLQNMTNGSPDSQTANPSFSTNFTEGMAISLP